MLDVDLTKEDEKFFTENDENNVALIIWQNTMFIKDCNVYFLKCALY